MRPQYTRPQSTVETTVKSAKMYHITLCLGIGRFRSITPKMFTMEMRLLL